LKAGDEVVTTTHDYPRMIHTWRQRQARDGIVLKMVSYPAPPQSMGDLVRRIEQAITPRTKVILVCHMTFTTGQIFPVKEICRLGRERNIEVIIDGAHSFGHFPFKQADLDCDYYGTSLHKWTMAPGGTGFTFIRRSKIANIWPLQPADAKLKDDIRKFEQVGTHSPAQHNAIIEALNFMEALGVERKAARFRYLRERWTTRLARLPRIQILTSSDPAQSCCLGTLSVKDADTAFHSKLADTLESKYGILVAAIGRGTTDYLEFHGIRVTPNFFTSVREVDAFSDAVEKELKA
ncbi:MAG: aminotransferase class V-fold PLP-dependent enzyme, partial [Acidobacteria bacterium]|nr:aminotransferase class V-fold PLP-dependent enzyme [Acidobacteriota bacterium]